MFFYLLTFTCFLLILVDMLLTTVDTCLTFVLIYMFDLQTVPFVDTVDTFFHSI